MGRLDRVLAFAEAQPRWFVYAVSDLAGAPVYVGATSHPERRYRQHRDGSRPWQPELTAWMQAHLGAHQFEVLDTFPTKRMMLDAEAEYIAHLRPILNPGRWPIVQRPIASQQDI